MNLKSIFLILSSIACNTMHSSQVDVTAEQNSQAPQNIQTTSQEKAKVTSYLTPPSIKPVDATPAPSNFFTTAAYGILKHAGKTDYEILMDLAKSGTLQADYATNRSEAFNRFNAAARERFKEKDLLLAQQQEKIANLFSIASKIDADFVLAKALAAEYFTLQKDALEKTLKKQANEIEPALRKIRNDIIQQADKDYIDALTKQLEHAHHAASNCQYLYRESKSSENFTLQKEEHYQNITAFSELLATINKDVEIADDTNLYHLPKKK